MTDDASPEFAEVYPPGEYAIVELFGHTTLVGRIAEIERFGAKMLAIEPLFNNAFLGVVFHGGAAIYRLTPCSAEVAWHRQAKQPYELPTAIRATLAPEQLPAPAANFIDKEPGVYDDYRRGDENDD